MTRLLAVLREIGDALDGLGRQWALVGGMAVSAWVEPRFTRDIDVAVAVADDAEAEALVNALGIRGWSILSVVEQDALGRLATVRLSPRQEARGGVVVDLLFASSGIEPEIVAAAPRIELVAGWSVPVACAGHLVALELLARDDERRPQDAMDLRALIRALSEEEEGEARRAVALIERRGYHRGRDLLSRLDEALGIRKSV